MRASVRMTTAALSLSLVLPFLGGCGPGSQSPDLAPDGTQELQVIGAGSTFAAPFIQKLMAVYRSSRPDLRLVYQAVGSGEGIQRVVTGTVDIGASDAPLNTVEADGVAGGVVQVPATAGMIAIAYNLPGVDAPLNLPRDVYADIFLGKHYRWDGPRLTAANPGVDIQCPDGTVERLSSNKLVLTTGAIPLKPDLPGMDLPGVFTLRWMDDTLRIHAFLDEHSPRDAVTVGGGYIGMEMTDSLARCGIAVTVVEAMQSGMTTLDPDLGARVESELTRHGVEVHPGTLVERITAEGSRWRVQCNSGFNQSADLVLIVVGARPETTLGANAGIRTGTNGAFRVNRRMETDLPVIYAAGDCVETWQRLTERYAYLPLGTTSHKQGRVAGENAVGHQREFSGSFGTQFVRLFDLVVIRTGLHDADARAAGLAPFSADSEHWDHKVYYPGAKPMSIRSAGERGTGRLLGAQIIGHYGTKASKRLDIFAAALHQGRSVDDLNVLDLSCTPPLSSPWDPVQMAVQPWVAAWETVEKDA